MNYKKLSAALRIEGKTYVGYLCWIATVGLPSYPPLFLDL